MVSYMRDLKRKCSCYSFLHGNQISNLILRRAIYLKLSNPHPQKTSQTTSSVLYATMKSDVKTAFTTYIDLNRFQHPMTGLCPVDDTVMREGKQHHMVFLLSWNQEFEESLKHARSTKSPRLRALKKVSRLCIFLFTCAIYLKLSI